MRLLLSAALLAIQSSHTLATAGTDKRSSTPNLPYDERTTPHCTWWLDYEDELSCSKILQENHIKTDAFSRWNPSVGQNCDGMQIGRAYCLEAAFEPAIATTPMAPMAPPTEPAPTVPENGIETPLPIQPGMVSDCNKFYLVQRGDTCAAIAAQHGISRSDFTTWNPKVGGDCAGLWAEANACVSVIGYTPTPTKPGSDDDDKNNKDKNKNNNGGVETPSPTQPGMVANCVRFHYVQHGESCAHLAGRYGVSVADLVAWNPRAGAGCEGLWAGAYACVGMPAFRIRSRYHLGCRGETHNDVTTLGRDGVCIDTDCRVGSLDVAAEGACPGGQVQISYWEKPGCVGGWYGYGYTSRGTCRDLWTAGWKFRSLHLRCMDSADDCVTRNTCSYDPEPASSSC